MALNFESKKQIVEQVKQVASVSIASGVAHYRGLNVVQMSALRKLALKEQVSLRVVKNALAKKALDNTDSSCLIPALSGPIVIGFSEQDPGAVARVFERFSKENEQLVVKGLAVSGKFVEASELKRIASLPSKDQAISLLMALMLAPVEKLTRTLNEVPSSVVRAIAAVKDTKQ